VSKPIKTSPLFSHLHNGPLASGGGKDSYRRSIHTPVTFPDRNVSDREEASLEPASSRPIRADFSWSEQISRIRTSPKRKCDASALSVGRFYEPNRWSVTIFLFVFVDSRDLWFLRHTCDAIMLPLLHSNIVRLFEVNTLAGQVLGLNYRCLISGDIVLWYKVTKIDSQEVIFK